MKFALVDNQKTEAKKGLKGLCPICQQPVIAKCGMSKTNIGLTKTLPIATNGGKMRLNGIGNGKIYSR